MTCQELMDDGCCVKSRWMMCQEPMDELGSIGEDEICHVTSEGEADILQVEAEEQLQFALLRPSDGTGIASPKSVSSPIATKPDQVQHMVAELASRLERLTECFDLQQQELHEVSSLKLQLPVQNVGCDVGWIFSLCCASQPDVFFSGAGHVRQSDRNGARHWHSEAERSAARFYK